MHCLRLAAALLRHRYPACSKATFESPGPMPPKRTAAAASGGVSKRGKPSAKAGTQKAAAGGAKASAAAPAPAAAVPDVEECSFAASEVEQVRTALLSWYDRSHRVLPWRRNPHSQLPSEAVAAAEARGEAGAPLDLPLATFTYQVWICEIMSQQTQVSRAAEYFRRWVARWPNVQELAAASQEEVNELWAGLGYYRRARYLLDGAKFIVNELGGAFPTTALQLQKIPGVGPYTSHAIASIACGERVAVVDGNVIRVLARLRRIDADPRSGAATKLWAELAATLLDPQRPGDFNQAMMELGATVCVPNTEPACGSCPIAAACAGYKAQQAQGSGSSGPRVTDYPAKVTRAEKREETVAVAVVQLLPPPGAAEVEPSGSESAAAGSDSGGSTSAGHFLLVQRPKSGLLAGLWEFPLLQVAADAAPAELQQSMNDYLQELLGLQLGGGSSKGTAGVRVLKRRPLGEVVHVFSHIRMTMKAEVVVLQGDALSTTAREADEEEGCAALQWVPHAEMQTKGLSSGVRKVYQLLTKPKKALAGKQAITNFFKPAPAKA